MTTTEIQEMKLSSAMVQGLREFYFHTTVGFTGGHSGTVERLNEHGGTLHGSHRYVNSSMRQVTMDALVRRELAVSHYDPRSAHGSYHYQLTPSGHMTVRNLFSAAELIEIDTYWQEQAMAEDLIRDRLADEVARGVGDPNDLSRTEERGRRYWVESLMREGWQQVQDELSRKGLPYDQESVRRELTRRQAAKHASLDNVTDDCMPDGTHFVPDETDWRRYEDRFAGPEYRRLSMIDVSIQGVSTEGQYWQTSYTDDLKALSPTQLIDRYARVWHRAANQPNNAELVDQLAMIKQAIGRVLEGWIPIEEIESWCDR